MFITSFGEQNITYKCCSNFLIHLLTHLNHSMKRINYEKIYMEPYNFRCGSKHTENFDFRCSFSYFY
ncbi:MAG: hypothetical protein EOM50_22570 [Erysipelotrichia bacterium]|nr:hypothetical protein [Erysipelotrichia bacterium]